MTVPKYPLPFDTSNNRLDDELVDLVADLIIFRTHLPLIDDDGPDIERLRAALAWFLYGTPLPLPVDERLAEPPGGPVPTGVEGHRQTGRDDQGSAR